MKAEKKRKRVNKIVDMKPGAYRAVREGIITKKSPMDLMKEEYSRRKYERKQKYKHK